MFLWFYPKPLKTSKSTRETVMSGGLYLFVQKPFYIFKTLKREYMGGFFCAKSSKRPGRIHAPAICRSASVLRTSKDSKDIKMAL
jgi:hypothetical protein